VPGNVTNKNSWGPNMLIQQVAKAGSHPGRCVGGTP
jgi:hypothetical protein